MQKCAKQAMRRARRGSEARCKYPYMEAGRELAWLAVALPSSRRKKARLRCCIVYHLTQRGLAQHAGTRLQSFIVEPIWPVPCGRPAEFAPLIGRLVVASLCLYRYECAPRKRLSRTPAWRPCPSLFLFFFFSSSYHSAFSYISKLPT